MTCAEFGVRNCFADSGDDAITNKIVMLEKRTTYATARIPF